MSYNQLINIYSDALPIKPFFGGGKTIAQLMSEYRTPIMGFAIISIMIYHQQWFSSDPFSIWMHHLGYIGVEVFLILSGFGIAHSFQKNLLQQFFMNRAIRLLPSCIIWGILKLSLSSLPSFPPCGDFFLELFSISSWYIYAIIIYYLLAPLLFRINANIGWWSLASISVISILTVYVWHENADANFFLHYGRWIVKRLPVFVMGMLITQRPINLKPSIYIPIGILIFLIAIFMVHAIVVYADVDYPITNIQKFVSLIPNIYDVPDRGRFLLDMLSTIFLIPALSLAYIILKKLHFSVAITLIGNCSLEIYLCHQYIFKIFEGYNYNNTLVAVMSSLIFTAIITTFIRVLSKTLINKL